MNGYSKSPQTSYLNDEARYRIDFARSHEGKGQLRLYQVSIKDSSFSGNGKLGGSLPIQPHFSLGRFHILGFPGESGVENGWEERGI